MSAYVITVEFALRPGARAIFLPLIQENAAHSLADEPGCRRFDVLIPDDAEDRVFLYEIYDDEASFGAHCRSAHFQRFDEASAPLVLSKAVRSLVLTNGAPPWRGEAEAM